MQKLVLAAEIFPEIERIGSFFFDKWNFAEYCQGTLHHIQAPTAESGGPIKTAAKFHSGVRPMTEQRIAKSNNSLFERDCARAGLPKDSLVSPALAKIVKAQNRTRSLHNAERERERKGHS